MEKNYPGEEGKISVRLYEENVDLACENIRFSSLFVAGDFDPPLMAFNLSCLSKPR